MSQRLVLFLLLAFSPLIAWADAENTTQALDLTKHWVGYLAIGIFAVAYLLAMTEEVNL